jgi:hypothetical protein
VVVIFNDRVLYHPLVIALRTNGFHVLVTKQEIPPLPKGKRVIISIPERGLPLDIIFYGDDLQKSDVPNTLKIFLVDIEQSRQERAAMANDNIVFMDRTTFDIRLLLHTLDVFFERIIVPEKMVDGEGEMVVV